MPTQVRAFLESTRNDRLHPLWRCSAMTGMRRGEVLGLKWEDIDFEAGRLSVRRSLIPLGGDVIVSEPKTARGRRSIALDPETVEVLKAQAAHQLAEQQQFGEAWTDSGYICTKEDGKPYHPEVVSRYFRQAVRAPSCPRSGPHDLRHTHATLALRAGIHPKVVSERLGHATVRSPSISTRTPSRPCRRRRLSWSRSSCSRRSSASTNTTVRPLGSTEPPTLRGPES